MTPNQALIYVVGDIHGRIDLLRRMVDAINQHARGRQAKTIFLGDYVDRGPGSSAVVSALMTAQRLSSSICLRGNHEDMMVRAFRGDPEDAGRWIAAGGDETLRSYGGTGRMDDSARKIPSAHLDWLQSLPVLMQDRYRIYVHGGLVPGRPAAHQDEEAVLWIRERFLRASASEFPDGKHIVHGHTPQWEGKPEPCAPELLTHRTNLDTGAFRTGVLMAGVFDQAKAGGPIALLSVTQADLT